MPKKLTDITRDKLYVLGELSTTILLHLDEEDRQKIQLDKSVILIRMMDDYLNRGGSGLPPWEEAQIENLRKQITEFLYS